MLYSDPFEGQIEVGVRSVIPVEGVTLTLGNTVAGGHIWADVP